MSLVSTVSGLFKWRQFEPEVILLAIGWYLRFSLSYRDVEELLAERGDINRPGTRLNRPPRKLYAAGRLT
jgi:transposase-like protein